jgi:ribose transport system substrate-binding protein
MNPLLPRNSACLFVLSLCLLLLGSCKQQSLPEPKPTPSVTEQKNHPNRTFAIIYPMSHPFFETITKQAEEAAAKQQVSMIIKSPDEANLEQQIRMMETLIKQKVDGIAIDPIDPNALTPYINKAMEAGIKVICFDSDAPASKRLSYIGTNNREAGKHLAETVAGLMKGRGMILGSTGASTMLNMKERIQGFQETLNNYPDIQLLELRSNQGDPAIALKNLEEMIGAHPHFDAFVGMDSLSGPAAILVWKAKGLHQTAVSFDDMPDILSGITNGQLTATISQRANKWGELLVTRLNQACDGPSIPLLDDTGIATITKENVKEYPFN